jgi:hypothetical protein
LANDTKRVKEAVAAIKMRLKTGHGKSRILGTRFCCAHVAALHALVAHVLRAAIQLADRCMRACGTSFHAAVASSLLSRLVKVRQYFCSQILPR